MKRLLVATLVLALVPVLASAASVTYTLNYATSTDSTFTSFADMSSAWDASAGPKGLANPVFNPAYYHILNVSASVTGLAAGEDVNQLGLGFNLGAGLTASSIGWSGSDEMVGVPKQTGGTQQVPVLSSSDAGPSATDLLGIVAEITQKPAWKSQFGEAGSAYNWVGSIYVLWDGLTTTTATVFGDPPTGSTWVTWAGNATGTSTVAVDMPIGTSSGGAYAFTIPEPATMGLLAIGAIGLIRRRR